MKKVDINRILTDVLSVVFNNEGSNSPEDITDYVDSETILDYMLAVSYTHLTLPTT